VLFGVGRPGSLRGGLLLALVVVAVAGPLFSASAASIRRAASWARVRAASSRAAAASCARLSALKGATEA
jgi:hypothetical protein